MSTAWGLFKRIEHLDRSNMTRWYGDLKCGGLECDGVAAYVSGHGQEAVVTFVCEKCYEALSGVLVVRYRKRVSWT